MRNRSPRSFTVVTKSGGRQRPIIPHRAIAPVALRPAVSWPPPAELKAPAVESRRILPSLIVPEPAQVEAERMQVSEEPTPRPRRGRPPKVKPVAVDMVGEPIAEPVVEFAVAAPETTPAPRPAPALQAPVARTLKPPAALAPGERWKRRLGRWAR